jgi:hypothetical protein
MNCLDFRRAILANPRQLDEAARAHSLECAGCRDFLDRQRDLDAELFAAMQVPPPDGLADRILVARGLRPARRPMAWAVAATIVLAMGIAWVGGSRIIGGDALGREAIAHVIHEPQALTIAHAVASDMLPALLADQGLKAVASLGQVSYATFCPMGERIARHLVVRTAEGPVTLLLMPDDPAGRRRALTEGDGLAALVLPAARGSIAIVAASPAQVLAIEKALSAT